MGFFKRKAKQEPKIEISPPVCKHKWKDFNWYLETAYWNDENSRKYVFNYKVIEPYICVLCHERKNVVLHEDNYENCTLPWIKDTVKDLHKNLPQLKHHALVENDIHDFMMVDRSYLKIMEGIQNPLSEDGAPKLKI